MTNSSDTQAPKKPKYVEPTLHFHRKRILVGPEGHSEKIVVSELVKQNQHLLSFPQYEKFAAKGFEKSPIRSGKNTHFSDDGEILLASTIGYPRVDIMKQEEGEEPVLLISLIPLVKVSGDCMKATLLLHPPISEDFSIRKEPLPELLKEAGILFGIDQTALQDAQNIIGEGYNDYHDIPIACGQLSEQGVDSYLQFALEIGPIAGQLLEDGSIDFRERRIMIGVTENQLLATKIPAIPGAYGINVLGEELEPDGGTEIEFILKHDVTFIEESGEILATKDGIFTVVNNCEIKVCSKQEIGTDIDYNTGHIDSKNSVVIRGAVQPGFKVSTVGDLEIQKEVMSATLKSKANIVIKGGITGKKTSILALGDIDFKFIEQGRIEAGGNIIMRKQSYYSDLAAKGAIVCQDSSTIVGGDIIAGNCLTVANVGSPNAKPSFLAAGVDIDRLRLQRELTHSLIKQQNDIIQWLQLYGGTAKSKKVRKMEAEVSETKMNLLKLNLIPGSGVYSRVGDLKGTMDDTVSEEDEGKKPVRIDKIFIDLRGTIYSGTEVRIGNCTLTIKKNLSKRRLKLNKNMKRIIAVPIH